MFNKKECVAMLLAGGQGSRLYALTNKIAKPAVTYGAKYRIIDFPLSNCVNSGIDTVGVLTQYEPLLLNRYIGAGQPWDLDRNFGGVHILPPYQGKKKGEWYKGTANAGDHIYKMDYSKMLAHHKEHGAELTIAVLEVPWEEASRFGIMTTNAEARITEFNEKPAKPTSNLASMGIYIFNTDLLFSYLEADEKNPASSNDFGKNIIPTMLKDGRVLSAYPFSGYWKDVGTIQSLWDANMDLLSTPPQFDLFEPNWKIYSRNEARPPQFIAKGAVAKNSLIADGSFIEGIVMNSLLSSNVHVGKGTVIRDSIIFADTVIGEGCTIDCAIIDEHVTISPHATIGGSSKITVIGSDTTIGEGVQIACGEMVETDRR